MVQTFNRVGEWGATQCPAILALQLAADHCAYRPFSQYCPHKEPCNQLTAHTSACEILDGMSLIQNDSVPVHLEHESLLPLKLASKSTVVSRIVPFELLHRLGFWVLSPELTVRGDAKRPLEMPQRCPTLSHLHNGHLLHQADGNCLLGIVNHAPAPLGRRFHMPFNFIFPLHGCRLVWDNDECRAPEFFAVLFGG